MSSESQIHRLQETTEASSEERRELPTHDSKVAENSMHDPKLQEDENPVQTSVELENYQQTITRIHQNESQLFDEFASNYGKVLENSDPIEENYSRLTSKISKQYQDVLLGFQEQFRPGHSPKIEDHLENAIADHSELNDPQEIGILVGLLIREELQQNHSMDDFFDADAEKIIEHYQRRLAASFEDSETAHFIISRSVNYVSCKKLIFGNYKLISFLKQGGMGKIYVGRHRYLRRGNLRAIKMYRQSQRSSTYGSGSSSQLTPISEESKEKNHLLYYFHREIELSSHLVHPNVVRALDAGRTREGDPFLALEFIEGLNLKQISELMSSEKMHEYQREHGYPIRHGFPVGFVVEIIMQTSVALQYAHGANVVHRDIKPENIMITLSHSENGVVKILDWGVAMTLKSEKQSEDSTLDVEELIKKMGKERVGTEHYMPPEQWANAKLVDHRADYYALGSMMYQLLHPQFEAPFEKGKDGKRSSTIKVMNAAQCEKRPELPNAREIPQAIRKAYKKLMAIDPQDRYESLEDLQRDLRPFQNRYEFDCVISDLQSVTTNSRLPRPPQPIVPLWKRKSFWLVASIVICFSFLTFQRYQQPKYLGASTIPFLKDELILEHIPYLTPGMRNYIYQKADHRDQKIGEVYLAGLSQALLSTQMDEVLNQYAKIHSVFVKHNDGKTIGRDHDLLVNYYSRAVTTQNGEAKSQSLDGMKAVLDDFLKPLKKQSGTQRFANEPEQFVQGKIRQDDLDAVELHSLALMLRTLLDNKRLPEAFQQQSHTEAGSAEQSAVLMIYFLYYEAINSYERSSPELASTCALEMAGWQDRYSRIFEVLSEKEINTKNFKKPVALLHEYQLKVQENSQLTNAVFECQIAKAMAAQNADRSQSVGIGHSDLQQDLIPHQTVIEHFNLAIDYLDAHLNSVPFRNIALTCEDPESYHGDLNNLHPLRAWILREKGLYLLDENSYSNARSLFKISRINCQMSVDQSNDMLPDYLNACKGEAICSLFSEDFDRAQSIFNNMYDHSMLLGKQGHNIFRSNTLSGDQNEVLSGFDAESLRQRLPSNLEYYGDFAVVKSLVHKYRDQVHPQTLQPQSLSPSLTYLSSLKSHYKNNFHLSPATCYYTYRTYYKYKLACVIFGVDETPELYDPEIISIQKVLLDPDNAASHSSQAHLKSLVELCEMAAETGQCDNEKFNSAIHELQYYKGDLEHYLYSRIPILLAIVDFIDDETDYFESESNRNAMENYLTEVYQFLRSTHPEQDEDNSRYAYEMIILHLQEKLGTESPSQITFLGAN
ncbi:serine/threonine-protein kinase [uncultured Rubinisphaera sp.]|uniref:serine/threonine protein kinase n=1 Tax=uncultured Rubinisphaera sp. TaxID=1678686 RepID=UPI0030DC69CF